MSPSNDKIISNVIKGTLFAVLFVLSGVLLAIAKIKTTEKKDNNTINFENEERKSRFNSRRNDGKYY